MTTLSSPTLTTNTRTPFVPKSPQLCSRFKKCSQPVGRSAPVKVSCKKNNDDQFQSIPQVEFDRRNMLFGLGGMYGAALTLGGGAQAAPLVPNLYACDLTKSDESTGDRCCPPAFAEKNQPRPFEFEKNPVMKYRRPAHKAMKDKEWLADYKRAIAIMKSLPMSDPRNFIQQARVHCAYCDGAYPILENSTLRYEVHGAWLFAPFHRWYLYFFERILGRLINKPTFALPYWNWDHPDGMKIPEMFKEVDSPLYDPNRSLLHQDKVINLAYNSKEGESTLSDDEQKQRNLLLMRKQMLYVTKPSVFFGDPYRLNVEGKIDTRAAGALELAPHNAVTTPKRSINSGQIGF